MACSMLRQNQETGRGRGARTPDLRFWRPPLYQLSYTPNASPGPSGNRAPRRWYGAPLRRLRTLCKPVFEFSPSTGGNLQEIAQRLPESAQWRLCASRKHPLPTLSGTGPNQEISGIAALFESRIHKRKNPAVSGGVRICNRGCDYSMMEATIPAPTVRPPSRIAKRSFSSIAIGTISSTSTVTLSPGITISVPSGSVTMPVTSVVRK